MTYLVVVGFFTFLMAAGMTIACYLDAKNYNRREDILALRLALVALLFSPLAGFWVPLVVIGLIIFGLYRAVCLALRGV